MNYQAGGKHSGPGAPGSSPQLTGVTIALWALGPRERVCLAAPRKAALQQRTCQEPGYESSGKGGLFLSRLPSGELREALAALSCEAPIRLGEAADRCVGKERAGRHFPPQVW